MNAQSKPTGKKILVLGFVLAALLLGGLGSTAAAAQTALPGDALYKVKTTIEDTRFDLAQDARERAQMQIGFAERRLAEISSLVGERRYSSIDSAVLAFETAINRALVELQTISKSDPAGAASLAGEITQSLSRYAQALSELAASAPESVRPELSRALDSTQLAGGLGAQAQEIETTGVVEAIRSGEWVISGQSIKVTSATEIKGAIQVGDQVKAHLQVGADGSLQAREIELAAAQAGEDKMGDDGAANANTNDDGIGTNMNEAGDDGMGNANMNEAGDDGIGTNTNEAGDDGIGTNTNEAGDDGIGNANTNDDSGAGSNTNDDKGGTGKGQDDKGGSGKGGNDNGNGDD